MADHREQFALFREKHTSKRPVPFPAPEPARFGASARAADLAALAAGAAGIPAAGPSGAAAAASAGAPLAVPVRPPAAAGPAHERRQPAGRPQHHEAPAQLADALGSHAAMAGSFRQQALARAANLLRLKPARAGAARGLGLGLTVPPQPAAASISPLVAARAGDRGAACASQHLRTAACSMQAQEPLPTAAAVAAVRLPSSGPEPAGSAHSSAGDAELPAGVVLQHAAAQQGGQQAQQQQPQQLQPLIQQGPLPGRFADAHAFLQRLAAGRAGHCGAELAFSGSAGQPYGLQECLSGRSVRRSQQAPAQPMQPCQESLPSGRERRSGCSTRLPAASLLPHSLVGQSLARQEKENLGAAGAASLPLARSSSSERLGSLLKLLPSPGAAAGKAALGVADDVGLAVDEGDAWGIGSNLLLQQGHAVREDGPGRQLQPLMLPAEEHRWHAFSPVAVPATAAAESLDRDELMRAAKRQRGEHHRHKQQRQQQRGAHDPGGSWEQLLQQGPMGSGMPAWRKLDQEDEEPEGHHLLPGCADQQLEQQQMQYHNQQQFLDSLRTAEVPSPQQQMFQPQQQRQWEALDQAMESARPGLPGFPAGLQQRRPQLWSQPAARGLLASSTDDEEPPPDFFSFQLASH